MYFESFPQRSLNLCVLVSSSKKKRSILFITQSALEIKE